MYLCAQKNLRRIFAILISIGVSIADVQADRFESSVKKFYAEDIKVATLAHIRSITDSDGVFQILDEKTEQILKLKFITIHDPVRQIDEDIYFACTDFHLADNPNKIYDIDFWLDHENSVLKVYQSKVHKEPRWAMLYGWYKHPRYTFVNNKIKYLY